MNTKIKEISIFKIHQNQPNRKKREQWNEIELQKYEEGIQLFGKNYKLIAEYIQTKTIQQVRSHAQNHHFHLKQSKESKDMKELKGLKELKELKDGQQANEIKSFKTIKDMKDIKDLNEINDKTIPPSEIAKTPTTSLSK